MTLRKNHCSSPLWGSSRAERCAFWMAATVHWPAGQYACAQPEGERALPICHFLCTRHDPRVRATTFIVVGPTRGVRLCCYAAEVMRQILCGAQHVPVRMCRVRMCALGGLVLCRQAWQHVSLESYTDEKRRRELEVVGGLLFHIEKQCAGGLQACKPGITVHERL